MPASGATLTFILIGAKIYRILYTYQLKLAYLFQSSTKKMLYHPYASILSTNTNRDGTPAISIVSHN